MLERVKHYLFHRYTVLAVVFVYTALTVASTTFSWVTSRDSVINPIEADGHFSVSIEEDFISLSEWEPGEKATKEVFAMNNGTHNAIVRMSFEEVMRVLNGIAAPKAVPVGDSVVPELIDMSSYEGSGWVMANTVYSAVNLPAGASANLIVKAQPTGTPDVYRYIAYYKISETMAQRVTAQFTPSGTTTLNVTNIEYWGFDGYDEYSAAWGKINKSGAAGVAPPSAADIEKLLTDDKEAIIINYANVITVLDANPLNNANKWFYNEDDGWFYYIGILKPAEKSELLIESLQLLSDTPSEYSGLELKLIVNLEAQQNTALLLTDAWGLVSGGALYNAIAEYCS